MDRLIELKNGLANKEQSFAWMENPGKAVNGWTQHEIYKDGPDVSFRNVQLVSGGVAMDCFLSAELWHLRTAIYCIRTGANGGWDNPDNVNSINQLIMNCIYIIILFNLYIQLLFNYYGIQFIYKIIILINLFIQLSLYSIYIFNYYFIQFMYSITIQFIYSIIIQFIYSIIILIIFTNSFIVNW